MAGGRRGCALVLVAALGLGCSDGAQPKERSELAATGERIYQNVCIACHNADPNQDGALGPAIAGSSRELIEARVLHGTYPEGYTPKRSSAQMPRFEYLADHIDALTAYLDEAATDGAGPSG